MGVSIVAIRRAENEESVFLSRLHLKCAFGEGIDWETFEWEVGEEDAYRVWSR